MANDIDFAHTVSGPEIDLKDEVCCIDFAGTDSQHFCPISGSIGRKDRSLRAWWTRTGHLLDIQRLTSVRVSNAKPHTGRGCDWPPILHIRDCSALCPSFEEKQQQNFPLDQRSKLTLSPKPHMRARMGCCTISRLCNE